MTILTLSREVYQFILDDVPEKGYELCYKELMKDPNNKETMKCLAVLSMVVGNYDIADWYIENAGTFDSLDIGVVKRINDTGIKQRWSNYRRNRNQQELKRMAETAPLCHGKVLEIGCANGDLSIFIASHGAMLYGIDIDPVAIDIARHKTAKLGVESCHFQTGNGYELQFPDCSFDTVVVAEVLEHVSDPKRIIVEAARVCKPGGTIIISVPNGYSIPDIDHVNIFTKSILNNLVEFSINHSLVWNDNVPEEWILGSLIKQDESDTLLTDDDKLESYFLPHPFILPKSDSLVSVLIPTYNRGNYIKEAVESVLNQTHKNIELIVVDDGSLISPKAELEQYMDRISYIEKENGGKSSALNEAIKRANGEFVWVFDDDDISLPLKLELQLKRFLRNPNLGLVHTRSIDFNNAGGKVVRVHDLSHFSQDLDLEALIHGCFIHGPTVLFRKEVLDHVGGWDDLLIRAQDYDFWLRVARVYDMEYYSVPTVRYRLHTGSRGSADQPVEHDEIISKTFEYEQIIFKKLYQTVPVNEIYRKAFNSDNITLMLEALIDRAVVFTSKGLLEEVKQDLKIVRDNAVNFGNPCFSAAALHNISKLATTAVQNQWTDIELTSSLFDLVEMISNKN